MKKVPEGMKDVNEALNALHIISHMFGDLNNYNSQDVLRKLNLLGYSDDAGFHLLWYLIHVIYTELEEVVGGAVDYLSDYEIEIQDVLFEEKPNPFVEAVKLLYCMDEDIDLGGIKPSWQKHFKARYRKLWRKLINRHDSSVPYWNKILE